MACELYLNFKKNKWCTPRRRAFPREQRAWRKHQDLEAWVRAAAAGAGGHDPRRACELGRGSGGSGRA